MGGKGSGRKPKEKPSAPSGEASSTPPEAKLSGDGSGPSAAAQTSSPTDEQVGVAVEGAQAPGGNGFRLADFLSLGHDDSGGAEPPKRSHHKGGKKQAVKVDPDELSGFILVPALLVIGGWVIRRAELPEAIGPEQEEVEAFAQPAARIIVRHLPAIMAGPDAIDFGMMLVAGVRYGMRIAPLIKELRQETARKVKLAHEQPPEPDRSEEPPERPPKPPVTGFGGVDTGSSAAV
jgi:hypothetical protein